MGTLMSDGQTHVQRIFVRQGACSGLEVSENRDKSTIQKWAKNRSGPTPQIQKTPIYRQIASPEHLKMGSKMEVKNRTKMVGKSTSKIASGAKSTTSPFSKAGLRQTAIWSVNFPKHSKPGPIPKKPNETGNFRGGHQPKKNHENDGQKRV
jgi:hypothetical protein